MGEPLRSEHQRRDQARAGDGFDQNTPFRPVAEQKAGQHQARQRQGEQGLRPPLVQVAAGDEELGDQHAGAEQVPGLHEVELQVQRRHRNQEEAQRAADDPTQPPPLPGQGGQQNAGDRHDLDQQGPGHAVHQRVPEREIVGDLLEGEGGEAALREDLRANGPGHCDGDQVECERRIDPQEPARREAQGRGRRERRLAPDGQMQHEATQDEEQADCRAPIERHHDQPEHGLRGAVELPEPVIEDPHPVDGDEVVGMEQRHREGGQAADAFQAGQKGLGGLIHVAGFPDSNSS